MDIDVTQVGRERASNEPLFSWNGTANGTSAFPPFAAGAADAVRTLCSLGGAGLGARVGLGDAVCLLACRLVLLARDCDFFCG